MKKLYKNLIVYVLLPIAGVLSIDYLAHYFLTSPMETIGYFIFKMFLISIMFLIIFMSRTKITTTKTLFYGFLFYLLMAIYYRIYELGYNLPLFTRTPSLTFSDNVIVQAIFWLLIHSFTFIIPFLIAKKVMKK